MKSGFWKGDWLLGLGVVVAFTAANLSRIAIIAIDQQSIDIGRWPWSRDVHAKTIGYIAL
ncbi:MAG: CHASE2 domain-containing protein [Burkholderiales bacterium]